MSTVQGKLQSFRFEPTALWQGSQGGISDSMSHRLRTGGEVFDFPGYNVVGEIGRGGMATVYRARQVLLDREVALKVLIPTLSQDPVYAQRFLQEARMLASLAHPNIVSVYDVGVTPAGLHYFSMQMVPGGDFALRLANGVDEVELIRVVSAVCDALGFAHARGYVHRDVTPANILFDERNKPVLTDFGIARALASSSRMTASGLSIGTSHYMSPEQARGGEVDRRSDIYSLGVMVFEALTGKPPYDGEDGFAVAYAHVHEPLPRLPEPLSRWQPLIDTAMAKSPDQRFNDCQAFRVAMMRIAGGRSAEPASMKEDATLIGRLPSVAAPMLPSSDDGERTLIGALPAIRKEDIQAVQAEPPRTTKLTTPRPAPAAAPKPAPQPRPPSPSSWRWWHAALVLLLLLGAGALGMGLWLGNKSGKASVAATTQSQPAQPDGPTAPPGKFDPYVPGRDDAEASPSGDTVAVSDETPEVPVDPETGEALPDGADAQAAQIYTVNDPVEELLAFARINMANKRYTTPAGRNALERYAQVLKLEPNNKAARAGIAGIAQAYLDMAAQIDPEADAKQWLAHLEQAESVAKTYSLNDAAAAAVKAKQDHVDVLVARAEKAISAWNGGEAEAALAQAKNILPAAQNIAAAARKLAGLGKPGYVFADALGKGNGPEMVVLGRYALGRKPVTVGEFRRYWEAEGRSRFGNSLPSCKHREGSIFSASRKRTWESPEFAQGDAHPVVCVNAEMAEGYAAWLGKAMGKGYRLPTSNELTGAGVAYRGDCSANVRDLAYQKEFGGRDAAGCNDGFAGTSPVTAFALNNSGLYDAGGNVRQWAACPAGACRERPVVGASWYSEKGDRAIESFPGDTGFNTVGFRIARDVP